MPFSTFRPIWVLLLALTGAFAQDNPLATAAPFALTGAPHGSAACGGEIAAIHGVWRSPQVYVPLYADEGTVAYLAALGAKAAGVRRTVAAVLPVYSNEPVHFRRGNFVFLSTALIVEAHDEQELIDAIQADSQSGRTNQSVGQAACATWTPGSLASLPEIQQMLGIRLAEYAKWTAPGLKRREGLPHHQPAI